MVLESRTPFEGFIRGTTAVTGEARHFWRPCPRCDYKDSGGWHTCTQTCSPLTQYLSKQTTAARCYVGYPLRVRTNTRKDVQRSPRGLYIHTTGSMPVPAEGPPQLAFNSSSEAAGERRIVGGILGREGVVTPTRGRRKRMDGARTADGGIWPGGGGADWR